jgi:hypothetical protein
MHGELQRLAPFIFPDPDEALEAYYKDIRQHPSTMTRKQKDACRIYGYHHNEYGSQSGAAYHHINQYIRDLYAGNATSILKEYQKYAKTIHKALAKHARRITPTPLYRGTREVSPVFSDASIGDVVEMNQFVSMTNNPLVANSFCDPRGAMLIIRNASGISIGGSGLESEYLGRAGTHFRIDKVYLQDWISDGLEHTDVTVFEVTMLDAFTSFSRLDGKGLNLLRR